MILILLLCVVIYKKIVIYFNKKINFFFAFKKIYIAAYIKINYNMTILVFHLSYLFFI